MRISDIEITQFRSIESLRIEAAALTAICGPNSCGKSNLLRALKFAFLPNYSAERMADNVCHTASSGNAAASVKLMFDQPTAKLSIALGIPPGQRFTYAVRVKRNGNKTAYLNGSVLNDQARAALLEQVLVVPVPAIRDIEGEGLRPFQDTLTRALRATRGKKSFQRLTDSVIASIGTHGRRLLSGARDLAAQQISAQALSVKSGEVDIEQLIRRTWIEVTVGGRQVNLNKLGTGHQSALMLRLYRELGLQTKGFVLYLFEEPDNHLHPSSVRAVADDLTRAATASNAQVFVTTHSPQLLNQFDIASTVALSLNSKRLTTKLPMKIARTDKQVRIALGKYGLVPAEALLAKRVIVVEGSIDVVVLRKLVELRTGLSPDRQDILVVGAGGKGLVSDLTSFMYELGVQWRAYFDWDAVQNSDVSLFRPGLSANDKTALLNALSVVKPGLHSVGLKQTKVEKLVLAMEAELNSQVVAHTASFKGSIIDELVRELRLLNQAAIADLEQRVRNRQPRKARDILCPAGIWLWSGGVEEILVRSSAAELAVIAVLKARAIAVPHFGTGVDQRRFVLNAMHGLAHEPDMLSEIIEKLWFGGHLDNSEAKTAVNFAVQ
jgi:predicted ATPase